MRKQLFAGMLLAASALSLSACGDQQSEASPESAQQMPPSAVSVIVVKGEPLSITNELPGRVAPTRIAQVRPRISGIVTERVFEQGSTIEAGDVLYQIDPAPFKVQVASAEATLQRAKAVQDQVRRTADRQQELAERRIVSTQQMEDAIGALAQADADVAIA